MAACSRKTRSVTYLEWAIDENGQVQWLQVRPVTTLSEIHYNELDTVKGESDHVWTLGNIGEMMPGVVTPLTYSVSFGAIGRPLHERKNHQRGLAPARLRKARNDRPS